MQDTKIEVSSGQIIRGSDAKEHFHQMEGLFYLKNRPLSLAFTSLEQAPLDKSLLRRACDAVKGWIASRFKGFVTISSKKRSADGASIETSYMKSLRLAREKREEEFKALEYQKAKLRREERFKNEQFKTREAKLNRVALTKSSNTIANAIKEFGKKEVNHF